MINVRNRRDLRRQLPLHKKWRLGQEDGKRLSCSWGADLSCADLRGADLRDADLRDAALIYFASDPTLERVPDWHANNEDAMADIERLAKLEMMR